MKIFNNNDNRNFSFRELLVFSFAFLILGGILSGTIVYKMCGKNFIFNNELNDVTKTYNEIISEYYEDVDKNELVSSAVNGMIDYLNENYSVYLDSENAENLNEKLEGEYQGIGIQVSKPDNYMLIENVYKDTPASDAGLQIGDRIYKLNDEDIKKEDELTEIVAKIQSSESVKLTIERDDKTMDFNINLRKIDYPVINTLLFNNNKTGYIYIENFSSNSYKQFKEGLEDLEKNKIESLVIDVRGNSGGYLTSVTDIVNMFLKKGKTIYSLETKNKNKETKDKTDEYREYPIVVLIDGASASASEVLASSLKESYGAILVGTQSFGKGKVQQTKTLSDDSMIKYTSAKWFTPSGESIDEKGLTPGITVYLSEKYANNPGYDTDDQLQKALELLNKTESN